VNSNFILEAEENITLNCVSVHSRHVLPWLVLKSDVVWVGIGINIFLSKVYKLIYI
jgi:hypothetical protein